MGLPPLTIPRCPAQTDKETRLAIDLVGSILNSLLRNGSIIRTGITEYQITGASGGSASELFGQFGDEIGLENFSSLLYPSQIFTNPFGLGTTQNECFGLGAGNNTVTGDQNTLFGYNAGAGITSGFGNTCIGPNAGAVIAGGFGHVFIGDRVGRLCTGGFQNIGIGNSAFFALTTGENNVAIGAAAMTAATTAKNNMALGSSALNVVTTGNENTGIGDSALSKVTTASHNTGIGQNAGLTLTTGADNTCVGHSSDAATATTNKCVALGYQAIAATGEFALSPYLTFQTFYGYSSTSTLRARADVTVSAADNTDATRKYRVVLNAWDTAAREFMRYEGDGAAARGAWFGSSSVAQQSGDIATALSNYGLVTSPTLAASKVVGASIIEFDHFANAGNVGTGEDDLYSDTILAGQLATDGDKLLAEYGGVFVSSATATRQIRIYFGGTSIFDTGALTLSLSSAWTAYVSIIRSSSSSVRYMASLTTEGAALAAYTAVGTVTGLTLTNTQVLKITGEAAGVGAATDDIVARLGYVEFKPAAASAVGATAPAFSGCRVYNSGSQTITNNTETDLTFDSERWDTASYHSTVSNTHKLTAPVSGWYRVGASVKWEVNATASRLLGIRYNGTGNYIVNDHRDATSGGLQTRMSVNTEYYFLSGEYMTVTVYQDSGLSRTTDNEFLSSPEAWMSLISPG